MNIKIKNGILKFTKIPHATTPLDDTTSIHQGYWFFKSEYRGLVSSTDTATKYVAFGKANSDGTYNPIAFADGEYDIHIPANSIYRLLVFTGTDMSNDNKSNVDAVRTIALSTTTDTVISTKGLKDIIKNNVCIPSTDNFSNWSDDANYVAWAVNYCYNDKTTTPTIAINQGFKAD